MQPLLYLDTARLGRMCPGALAAQCDFLRLAAAEGASPLLERFVTSGLPARGPWRSRYPALAGWRGLEGLKGRLRDLTGAPADLPVLLASRSSALMKVAARLLCLRCQNVLVTDLGWPPFLDTLADLSLRTSRALTVVPLLGEVLAGHLSGDEVVGVVRDRYLRAGCDGLFLDAVSSLGVRLPAARCVAAIESVAECRYVVIDGSQEIGHLDCAPSRAAADLYLAGAHKWLEAYQPLAMAFLGRRRQAGMVQTVLGRMLLTGEADDPLLRLSAGEGGAPPLAAVHETVNLSPLLSCHGAVEAAAATRPACQTVPFRPANHADACQAAAAAGWRPLLPRPELRSRILLVEAPSWAAARRMPPERLRARLERAGVVASCYPGGRVRLSLPGPRWEADEADTLGEALAACETTTSLSPAQHW